MSDNPVPSGSQCGAPSEAKCVFLNARSIKTVNREHNKLVALHNLVTSFDTHIIAITETWLTTNVLDAELLPGRFQVYRKDRCETCPSKRGGGLLLGIDHKHPSKRRDDLEGDGEILVCELTCRSRTKIALVLCYRPPSSDRNAFNNSLEQTLDMVSSQYQHVCLLGDFNLPEINWLDSSFSALSPSELEFIRIVNSNCLSQLNSFPSNVHGNFLDLIFATDNDLLCDFEILDSVYPTDHNVLSFTMKLYHKACQSLERSVYNYKRADIVLLNSLLNQISLDAVISDGVDAIWSTFNDQVMSAIEQSVPKVNVKCSRDPPWIDDEARRLIRRKQIVWRKAKKGDSAVQWQRYRALRNDVKALTKRKYDLYIESLSEVSVSNPKRFWSFFRCKTKSRTIPICITDGESTCDNSVEKASLFNDYFVSVFSQPGVFIAPPVNSVDLPLVHPPSVTPLQISAIMKDLDVNKACPPSDISPFVLKNCRDALSISLALIFNRCFFLGEFPSAWKRAHVVPIFKKGDKSLVSNYRPVSLLVGVSKILERCIVNHVYPLLAPHLHPLQHGFMKGKSCTTQLLKVYHSIGSILDRGGQIDIIFLDFSKAFDCVDHALLLYKLKMCYGFTDAFVKLFESYLSCRSQCVLIEGEKSTFRPVTSGVPQGSILGPLLFLLFINDMPDSVEHSTVALFADDSKVFKEIKSREDCVSLQKDLDALHQWSVRYKMNFNASKCKILTISRSHAPIKFDYNLDGSILENVGSFKDLGVILDQSLSFKQHITAISSKSNQMNGIVKRSVGFGAPRHVKLKLYKTLVRPTAEYSSQVWSPFMKNEILLIENVQRSMTRFILGEHDLSYSERCQTLELLPLSYRREIADLIFCFKCLNGFIDVDFSDELCVLTPNSFLRSSQNGLLLKENRTRTEHFKSMYFNRLPHLWNILPSDVRGCDTLSSFKFKLFNHYLTRLQSSYDVFNSCSWTSICRCSGFYHTV